MRAIGALLVLALAASGSAVGSGGGAVEEYSPSGESLLYNPRERTAKAQRALEAEEFETAAERLETAHRLAPESPVTLYNLGTGHLKALDPRAVGELEQALEVAPPALAAEAAYNLGNARMAANDYQGATEAFKQALRRRADFENAKFNLELALQKLEQQQQQEQQQQNSGQSSDDPSENEDGESEDESSPSAEEESGKDDSESGDQENEQQGENPEEPSGEGDPRRNPLPQFEEQPEMTAEQAAAILEAVDNLERQQRQADARDKARPVGAGGKDW